MNFQTVLLQFLFGDVMTFVFFIIVFLVILYFIFICLNRKKLNSKLMLQCGYVFIFLLLLCNLNSDSSPSKRLRAP
jgi:hypothetical protein